MHKFSKSEITLLADEIELLVKEYWIKHKVKMDLVEKINDPLNFNLNSDDKMLGKINGELLKIRKKHFNLTKKLYGAGSDIV